MTPRAFTILVCLIASRRWPRLRYVAASLVCEAISGELATIGATTAMVAWLLPSICMTSVGLSLALRRQQIAALFAVCQGAAYAVAGTCHGAVAVIAAASCAFTSAQLARHVTPGDVERSVVLALLAGNAATFVIMALFGVDNAYANDVVLTSNYLTHIAVAGLVLWAMRR